MYTHVPDAGELLIHCLHIVRANRYKGIHSNTGMVSAAAAVDMKSELPLIFVVRILKNWRQNICTKIF